MMDTMTDTINPIADVIYQHVKTMPQYAAREVLTFIQFLEFKQTHTVPYPTNNADILAFLQNLPKGHRDKANIDKELQVLRDEWGQAIATIATQHTEILSLYAKCLIPFGFFSQAANLWHQAYELSKHPNTLNEAIYLYGLAGRFHQMDELLKVREQLNPANAHPFDPLAGKVTAFMDERQVTDTDLEALIEIALLLLRQHKVSISVSQINMVLLEDEESQWFHYGIPLHEPVEKIVELDFELADNIAEQAFSTNLTGYFVPTFEIVNE